MKLFYLGRSQANAALSCGIRLDGTDKIENFEDTLVELFSPSDYHLIVRKSRVLIQLPIFKRLKLDFPFIDSSMVEHPSGEDADEVEFNLLFPEFIGPTFKPFIDYLDSHTVAITAEGDVILADCCEDTGSSYLERIFKALCDHLGVQAALCTPIWPALKERLS